MISTPGLAFVVFALNLSWLSILNLYGRKALPQCRPLITTNNRLFSFSFGRCPIREDLCRLFCQEEKVLDLCNVKNIGKSSIGCRDTRPNDTKHNNTLMLLVPFMLNLAINPFMQSVVMSSVVLPSYVASFKQCRPQKTFFFVIDARAMMAVCHFVLRHLVYCRLVLA
jgi:hypothetical protein